MTELHTERPERRDVKDRIYYTRAYRRLPRPPALNVVAVIVLAVVLIALVFLFRSELSYVVAWFGWKTALLVGADAKLVSTEFMWTSIYCVDSLAVYPTWTYAFISSLVCGVLLIVLPLIKKIPAPASYWFFYLILVQFVSSLFFLFFASYFPYTIFDYTSLYIKVELVMWMVIPVIVPMAVIVYPANFFHKFLLVTGTLLYSIVLGAMRMGILIMILEYGTIMFMAFAFFILGALLDFVYITGFFSLFMSRLAHDISGRKQIWRWLY